MSAERTIGLALCALALAVGCSERSRGSPSATTTAASTSTSAGFGVLATSPQDRELDVRPDATLTVTFTEDLDPTTAVANLSVLLSTDQGPVDVTVTAVTPRVLEVAPTRTLDADTNHLLRLTDSLASLAGAALPETLVVFRTGALPPPATSGPPTPPTTPAQPPFANPPPAVVGAYEAGAASVDVTPPVGVPLAGYGGGGRRRLLPDLDPGNYHTFLTPSSGVHDPIYAKSLVLGNGTERFCLVTLDAIATEARIVEAAWRKAAAQGFSVPLEKVLVCSSHTHCGPGALSKRFLWSILAADLYVDRVFEAFTDGIAQSMLQAEQALGPALVGTASTQVTTATQNRRHGDSPDLDPDSIDPELIVIRIDRPGGAPVATVWNFAIHGTIFGTHDLDFSADVMGSANLKLEAQLGGVALFLNGAEGDIKPQGDWDSTGQLLADAVLQARSSAQTQDQGVVQSAFSLVDLGAPRVTYIPSVNGGLRNGWFGNTLRRLGVLPRVTFVFPRGWVAREFRFQAVRVGTTALTSFPGEPIHELGLTIKRDGRALGFDHVIPACLANGHGSYFASETEFYYGGYESQATFFGPQTDRKVLDAARDRLNAIR